MIGVRITAEWSDEYRYGYVNYYNQNCSGQLYLLNVECLMKIENALSKLFVWYYIFSCPNVLSEQFWTMQILCVHQGKQCLNLETWFADIFLLCICGSGQSNYKVTKFNFLPERYNVYYPDGNNNIIQKEFIWYLTTKHWSYLNYRGMMLIKCELIAQARKHL